MHLVPFLLVTWHLQQFHLANTPDTFPPLTLVVHHQPPVPIKWLALSEAHCYLGMHIATNGDYRTELTLFQQCNIHFIGLLQQCPSPHNNVMVIYKQCYLPMVSYPLLATLIPVAKLYKLQSPATSVFLSKMGYPHTFPQAAVYVSSNHGGLGFCHLRHEQGIQKCLQFIKHICMNTSTGTAYHIVLQHYQLVAGISQPVLQDTQLLPWSFAPWLDNLQALLHLINGQILLNNPWCILPWQQHDCFIMEDALAYHLKPMQLQQIQSVRLYLWITLLSEISDHSGIHILTTMIYPAPHAHHN